MGSRELQRVSEKEWYFGDLSDNDAVQDGMGLKRERDGSLYFGGWNHGLREGFGMLGEPEGSLRVGTWSEDKSLDVSLRVWPTTDGLSLFFGKIENGKPKEGTLLCSDGRLYHGIFSEWRKDEFDGEGALVWPNQRIYAGHWKNGGTDIGGVIRRPDKADGKLIGTLSNVRKGFVSKSWPQDSEKQFFYGVTSDEEIRNAKGILFYQDGEFFAGEMIGGQKSGFGLLRTPNREFFFGNWENGSMQGQGVYVKWSQDMVGCYTGNFRDTCFDGEGCLFRRINDEWDFEYAGLWKLGKKSGDGFLNLGENQLYIGHFCDDQKDGDGEVILADGSRNSTSWKMGVPTISLDKIRNPGPSRYIYGEGDTIKTAVLNSLEKFSGIKELEFVGIRADANSDYQREMFIEPGCDYEIRIFYHNDATEVTNTADGTKIRAFYSKNIGAGQDGIVSASISSENTDTPIVWDCIKISSSEALTINYKIASAKVHNNWKSNGHILPQTLFKENGVYIGTDEWNGVLPAGESGSVTFVIHAGGKKADNSISFTDKPKRQRIVGNTDNASKDVPVSETETETKTKTETKTETSSVITGKKRKRSRVSVHVAGSSGSKEYAKKISADIGEEINIKIDFTNSASWQDMKISVDLPSALAYMAESTYVRLSDGSRRKQEDKWIDHGMLLPNFMGGGEGEIQFRVRYFPSSDDANHENKVIAMIETADISMRGELSVLGN